MSDIVNQIIGDNQPPKKPAESTPKELPELTIWKENGVFHWLAAYSNNRRDSDTPPEIISSESHKEFDRALHNKEWPMPELWLWHIDYPVGITEYHAYDETTGFCIAGGTFYKEMDWAAEGVREAGWDGVSHGMPEPWIKRDANDPTIIVRHRTKEITFLPPWAMANKLSFNIITKEATMADEKGLPAHKRPEFVAAFGEERVTQIEAHLANKAKEADEQGIEKKESPPETPKEPTMADIVKGLEFLATGLGEVLTRVKALEEKPAETKEAEEEWDLISILKGKSAIGQPTTRVDGRTKEGKDSPEETKGISPSEEIAGLPVSLIDKLVMANQAYYNGGVR